MMTNKELSIISFLDELFPHAKCELFYSKPYELLIAVVLSAQTTDKSVNQITPILFNKYQTLSSLADANVKEVEDIIKSIGLYKAKAKNIVLLAKELVDKYNGEVPKDKDILVTLPGVGNKTAGVTRLELFEADELPVDTHVSRIAYRLKYANKKDDPNKIEIKLKKKFPQEKWGKLHHQFIHFGRYFCTAKNPNCKNCKIKEFCRENATKS